MNINISFNTISHGFGAVLAVIGVVILLTNAASFTHTVVYGIYGLSLIGLYLASTAYHGLICKTKKSRNLLVKIDKTAIGLLIAGTTTPIGVLVLDGSTAMIFTGILWIGSIILGVLYFMPVVVPRSINVCIYLGMGWFSMILLGPLYAHLKVNGLLWLMAGGIFYSVGAAVYFFKWPVLHDNHFRSHELWHVLCLLGSIAHYILIYFYTV